MAMRVPFVLIKKHRRSELQLSMLKSASSSNLPTREALCFSCLFTDNMTLFFMTPSHYPEE